MWKNPAIPTHSGVGIQLSRNAMQKNRTYARTLPALKYFNEQRIRGQLKDQKDEKASFEAKKEDEIRLHRRMDEAIEDENEMMCKLAKLESLDEVWKKFSEIVRKHGWNTWRLTKTQQRNSKEEERSSSTLRNQKPGQRLKRIRA